MSLLVSAFGRHIPSVRSFSSIATALSATSFKLSLAASAAPFGSNINGSTIVTSRSRRTSMSYTSSSSSSSAAFWNREEFTRRSYEIDAPIIKEARIIALSSPGDKSNEPIWTDLPAGAKIVAEGTSIDDFDLDQLASLEPNVIFLSAPQPKTLAALIERFGPSSLEWIHARSAGLDAFMSDAFRSVTSMDVVTSNAKGSFSSTLAEYTMLAIGYFAKDLPRLLRNKNACNWEKYDVLEIRGARLGIVGYGDIGRAAAKLAVAYGMKVTALRRNPGASKDDPYVDQCLDNSRESLNQLFAECDYVLCSAPLTDETRGMIGKEQFGMAKPNLVFINVGRGPIVNEDEMVEALKDGRLRGVGLDVFTIEPLEKDSELWKLDNVLLSPHNMDQTRTFMHEASQFFVEENLPRFLRGMTLLNPVNPQNGY
jgi:phosphoglycerate dehydrogenase-like enzyme